MCIRDRGVFTSAVLTILSPPLVVLVLTFSSISISAVFIIFREMSYVSPVACVELSTSLISVIITWS